MEIVVALFLTMKVIFRHIMAKKKDEDNFSLAIASNQIRKDYLKYKQETP